MVCELCSAECLPDCSNWSDTKALVADLEQFSENSKDINKRQFEPEEVVEEVFHSCSRESYEFRTRHDF